MARPLEDRDKLGHFIGWPRPSQKAGSGGGTWGVQMLEFESNWGVLSLYWGSYHFGSVLSAPDFWKLPYGLPVLLAVSVNRGSMSWVSI